MRILRLALLPLIFLAQTATAQLQPASGLEPKMLDRTGRTVNEVFPYVRTLATTSCVQTATVTAAVPYATTTTQRTNVHGYIIGFAPGVAPTGITITTSIAPMMYASKVQIAISDVSGDTVPVCRGYEIRGDGWNGQSQVEIVPFSTTTVLSETVWPISSKSWSRITYFRLTGCDSMDADDLVMVRQTAQVALNWRVGPTPGTYDVLSVCLTSIGAGATAVNSRCALPSAFSYDTDIDANTINLLDLDFRLGAAGQTCPTDGSSFLIKYRANPGVRTY
jgi:hypothetical protein